MRLIKIAPDALIYLKKKKTPGITISMSLYLIYIVYE